jgi:hypothetical protein
MRSIKIQKSILPLLSLILIGYSLQKVEPSKDDVVMIFEMVRHGSRAPLTPFGPKSAWVDAIGKGELTNVGIRQRYNLGLNTKARYANLLNPNLKPNEFFVYSTDYNRTIVSAYAHIQGLQNMITTEALAFAKDDPRLAPPQTPMLFDVNTDDDTPLKAGRVPFPIHGFIGGPGDDNQLFEVQHKCPLVKTLNTQSSADLNEKASKSEKFQATLKKAKESYGITEDMFKEGTTDMLKCFLIADYMLMDY